MGTNIQKAILVVSFGTGVHETRRQTIDAIEQAMRDAYPERRVYRAWTGKKIRDTLLLRDHIKIDSVAEAFLRMREDKITDVTVQPTHVIDGIENGLMRREALPFAPDFSSLFFGAPLLTSDEDSETLARAVVSEFSGLSDRDLLLLMGHGTAGGADRAYAALGRRFQELGHENIVLETLESGRLPGDLPALAARRRPERVILAPFMIVAGAHAVRDMAGAGRDSWRGRLEAAGYPVECVMKGLGQYPAVRELLVRHAGQAV